MHEVNSQGGVKEGDASLTAYVINGALECCQAPNHPLFTSVSTNVRKNCNRLIKKIFRMLQQLFAGQSLF